MAGLYSQQSMDAGLCQYPVDVRLFGNHPVHLLISAGKIDIASLRDTVDWFAKAVLDLGASCFIAIFQKQYRSI